ncbi:MAG TPA: TIGR00730 family Rossman fold protein [Rhodospirillales bacterium]|nr:TIGR00730 family Rossman fold protein [Rhodospirillales bacterium]
MTEIKTICVFCGSRAGLDPDHEKAARHLGHAIADRGIKLVYGGGDIGLMSIVARATLEKGGHVTGVIPEFIQEFEVGNPGLSELIVVESMHERKSKMFELADGFVSLPGGLGTLDETLEVLTWKQLQQHRKPVVLVDINDYWRTFRELLQNVIDSGYSHHGIANLFSIVDDVDDVFGALESAPEPDIEVLTSHL